MRGSDNEEAGGVGALPKLISAGIYPNLPFRDILAVAESLDETRVDTLWLGDSHLIWCECWSTIAALAVRTASLRFGSSVSNPLSRHPSVTASTLATLQELSGGRVRLGIGVGDSSLRMTLGRVAKLRELRDAVGMIRTLLRGDECTIDGNLLRLSQPTRETEICVSGSGPKTLAMAGRLGDGVIVVPGLVEERVRQTFEAVEVGVREEGRRDFPDRILWIAFSVDDDRSKALDAVRPFVASILRHPLPFDVPAEIEEIRQRIRSGYDFRHHMAGSADHASAVPDHVVQEFAIAGTEADASRLLRTALGLDVDEVALVLMGEDRLAIAQRLTAVLARVVGQEGAV